MITLGADCLLFQMVNGESVPLSAEMINVELTGEHSDQFDSHFVQHAANAVFHYFKHDLGRNTVTVGEFAGALESVLRGFGTSALAPNSPAVKQEVIVSDLKQLVSDSGNGCELFFFPRLRDEMRIQLQHSPRLLRFRGLRGCVKQLTGTRRWSARCRRLEAQILAYLGQCFQAEPKSDDCTLVVQ